MALSAIQVFILALVWKILEETPFNRKHTYQRFLFDTLAAVQEVFVSAAPIFAPGLLEVLQASTPPTVAWFKSLPSDNQYGWELNNWAVYLLVLEKDGERTRIYIGSGTSADHGLQHRWSCYDNKTNLPSGVRDAFDDGFEITHKGLLCWIPLPTAGKMPLRRLLFLAIECVFTYIFWAMQPNTHDEGMRYICPWNTSDLEYDSICSHGSVLDHPAGKFNLTEEQLELKKEQKDQINRIHKKENMANYHHKNMELNYHEYTDAAVERNKEWRANNSQQYAASNAARYLKNKEEQRYFCKTCQQSFSTASFLEIHYSSEVHARLLGPPIKAAIKCIHCNRGFNRKCTLYAHKRTDEHKGRVATYPARMAAVAALRSSSS